MSSPDLVIGVDFGTTHTKVAWTYLSHEIVRILHHWPGQAGLIKAVPSKLQYGPNREVKEWGFLCDEEETEDKVRESFKVYLDQDAIEVARRNGTSDVPENTGDAIRLVSHYLRQVYRHIKSSIEAAVGPWGDKNIEFIFSCPSTWQALSTPNNFLEAIRAAGFGQESPLKHRATLELTSAEAVAVYAVSTPALKFEDGDILIVCNASGTTTEVGLFELFDSNPMHPSLRQVNAVAGVGTGSMTIDQEFQKLVQRKLDLYGSDTQIANHQDFSMRLAQSKVFQSIKHRFGTAGGDVSKYEIALHNLGLGITRDFCQPALRIDKGRMIFSRAEIQSIFDQMIGGLYQLIDNQLLLLRGNKDNGQVTIVLSGGFGTSVYLHKQLQKKYASTSISVVVSEEPIFAEVKGLVIDRKQRLLTGAATLISRVARASYGVLCRQVYNPKIHIGAQVEVDSYKKRQKWAVNEIEWIIRKGDTLERDSAREKPFRKKIMPGDPKRQWNTTIMISHNDRESLPRMTTQAGAFKLCDVKMDLNGVSERDFEEKNKRFWQGKHFFLATFCLRVIIAPTDLRFDLWFKNRKYSSGVEWDPAGASAKPMSLSIARGTDTSMFVETWGTVKPSALRNSQIGMSNERRVGSTIQPQDLRDVIYTGDVQETQSLLESDFDSVARDDFAWLRELKDLNYPERDIAELLINSEKDSPWIYFEPKANNDCSIIPGYHQPACVHHDRRRSPNSRGIVGSPFTFANRRLIQTVGSSVEPTNQTHLSWSIDEESLMCIINELCGIAGVRPDTRDLNKWIGQVLFSNDNPEMTASVTYRPNSKSLDTLQPSEVERAGTLVGQAESKVRDRALRDIVTVLERFCSAAAQSQQSGLCCDSFTILKKSRDIQGDAIDLTRVDLKLAVDLLDELKASRLDSDRNLLPESTAKSICELFLGSLSLGAHDADATLDLCSLAAQLLTLGFSLYARAHVDTFCPFFLDTPVHGIYLFGARDLSSDYPQAAATLHRFTCLNDMIEKPVMVFSKFSDDVENSGAFPLDLLATSTDLLDTWGPGRFVQPPNRTTSESFSITGILLGNGIIQPADEVGDPSNLILHWSKEISPVHASAKKFTWNKNAKMRIAGGVKVNENCQADLKLLWPLFTQALENLGTYQDYWAFTEFQAGLAIAGQQFVGGQLQFNKTWTWHDGNSWKQNFLGLLALDMPFDELERPWGLQVSFCTGVSRRVPLRILLADVMPILVQTLSLPPEWTVLEEQGIIKAFEGENLKGWLDSLNLHPKSQHLIPLVKRIVHYILLLLKDTGVDRTEQKFRIACPKNLVSGKPLAMCLEIPCNKGNLWTRILADTKDCATFACMTPLCLESEEHQCRQTDPWHCPSLQTAVCRYRAKDELLGVAVAGSTWRLQDQALYWIGNPKSGLQTRVKMSPDSKTARLHVSVSSMSEKTLSRLGTMRLLSKMGRKMDHIREKQYEDWEAEGVLVMADIKP